MNRSIASRLSTLGVVLITAGLLAGCGGGVFLGYTYVDDPYLDAPPQVQISPIPAVVEVGGTLVLGASAADEDGIDEVAFYRIDGRFATFLGADVTPPYQAATVIPGDRGLVSYFARATDRAGRQSDSEVVSATVVLP